MTHLQRGPGLYAIIALALVFWFGEGVLRGLWEPDEARYAYVATEMHRDDRWLVPHLHGEPYPDKPPLLFWLINAASVFTGGAITSLSARLPSLFGAILALWATARLTERWRDGAAAWRALLILSTCFLFWQEAGWGRTDALLLGFEMVAIYLLFRFNATGQMWRVLLAYVLIGLAMLTKGPVGLLVPLAVYIGGSWAAGEASALKRWHWLWGPLLACAIPGAWLLAAWKVGHAPEGYFEAMFTTKSFSRVIHDHHAKPFYYYLAHFPVEFLPWMLFLPSAYMALGTGSLRRRLVVWGGLVVVLFSCFTGKREIYILAAYPAAAMIVAAGWDGIPRLSRRWMSIPAWLAMGLFLLIGVAEVAALFLKQVPIARWPLIPAALVMLPGFIWLAAVYRRTGLKRKWFNRFASVHALHIFVVSIFVLPQLNPLKAPVALAREAEAKLAPEQPVYLYRDQLAIIPLYAHRPGRNIDTPEQFADLLNRERNGIVVFDAEDWAEVGPAFTDRVTARPFDMGHKHLVWVDFPRMPVLPVVPTGG